MKTSHCETPNDRLQYAKDLSKFIEVDIVGSCGSLSDGDIPSEDQYKFYLAFENSNCDDYITEKFFNYIRNGKVVPVVMGAKPEAYRLFGPQVLKIRI